MGSICKFRVVQFLSPFIFCHVRRLRPQRHVYAKTPRHKSQSLSYILMVNICMVCLVASNILISLPEWASVWSAGWPAYIWLYLSVLCRYCVRAGRPAFSAQGTILAHHGGYNCGATNNNSSGVAHLWRVLALGLRRGWRLPRFFAR